MEHSFWHQRWQNAEIGFHEGQPNHFLVNHIGRLNLAGGSRIFLPLCGKTRDIAWLLAQGYRVAGAELSTLAVDQLFAELGITPEISRLSDTATATATATEGTLLHYRGKHIEIFAGDIFALTADRLGSVDAVYDRAALVALPEAMRTQYGKHLPALTAACPQLLVTFEYEQSRMPGPPFSISADEVKRLYGAQYQLAPLETRSVEGGLKGMVPASETAWLLSRLTG